MITPERQTRYRDSDINDGMPIQCGGSGPRDGQPRPPAAAALDGPDALNGAIAQAESAGVMIEPGLLKGLVSKSDTLRMALVHQERALSAQTAHSDEVGRGFRAKAAACTD